MKKKRLVIAALTAVALAFTPAAHADGGNGYVMMIHMTSEPGMNDYSPVFVPPLPEAFFGTGGTGFVTFHAIVHNLNATPVRVSSPVLVVDSASGKHLVLKPNGSPSSERVCREETHYPGHVGSLSSCYVFRVPATSFTNVDIVTATLRFRDRRGPQTEAYNLPTHGMIHNYQESGHGDLKSVDANLTQATPIAIER